LRTSWLIVGTWLVPFLSALSTRRLAGTMKC
jgi:hypothetical protein